MKKSLNKRTSKKETVVLSVENFFLKEQKGTKMNKNKSNLVGLDYCFLTCWYLFCSVSVNFSMLSSKTFLIFFFASVL